MGIINRIREERVFDHNMFSVVIKLYIFGILVYYNEFTTTSYQILEQVNSPEENNLYKESNIGFKL